MKHKKMIFAIAAFLVILVILSKVQMLDDYVDSLKLLTLGGEVAYLSSNHAEELEVDTLPSPKGKDAEWLEQLRADAEKLRVAPIDARVDPVWKAIPGYNGKELDMEKSLELTKQTGTIQHVFKEVSPRVSLQDLGAHPVYKGNPQKPVVSFMINVAWGNEFIPTMLETLRQEQVKATFFFDGSWLKKHMDIAKQIAEDGHELSNHAYSHKNMSELSRAQAIEEISKTEVLLKEGLGVDNQLFAPPSGDYDEETVKIAHELGLQTVLWTLDTVDWKKPQPDWIVRKITNHVEPGSLILMHPTESSSKALLAMIKNIKNKGLELVTVSELLSPKRVEKVESELHF